MTIQPKNSDQAAIADRLQRTLNRVMKWRAVFAGWQLGTRSDTDPECKAVKDHRELTMLLRIELNALTGLMLEKGVFSIEEFNLKVLEEAEFYERGLEARFPGMTATDRGMKYDARALETMKGWKP